jgi:hypothetical protein
MRSIVTSDSVGPGTSMPWKSPRVPNRHEASSLEFGVDGFAVAGVAWVGEVSGAVQEGLALEVEGAADVFGPVLALRQAEASGQVGRQGGAGEHDRALGPEEPSQHVGDDDG